MRVNPSTFDQLVNKIEGHPIFYNNSNCPQLDPAMQLTIFLNHAGHYGNRCSPNDLADWAGSSTGMVQNCTFWIMIAILQLHDEVFRVLPAYNSELARNYIELATCTGWKNGKLTGDGTTFPLFE